MDEGGKGERRGKQEFIDLETSIFFVPKVRPWQEPCCSVAGLRVHHRHCLSVHVLDVLLPSLGFAETGSFFRHRRHRANVWGTGIWEQRHPKGMRICTIRNPCPPKCHLEWPSSPSCISILTASRFKNLPLLSCLSSWQRPLSSLVCTSTLTHPFETVCAPRCRSFSSSSFS